MRRGPAPPWGLVEVHDTAATLREEWDALVDEVGGAPFQRPGWIAAWWTAFGRDGDLRIATLRRDGRLLAVLPTVARRGRIRPPTNAHSPWFGLVARSDATADELLNGLIGDGGGRLSLSPVRAAGTTAAAVRRVATRAGHPMLERRSRESPFL